MERGMHVEYKPRTKGQQRAARKRYRDKLKREKALSGPVTVNYRPADDTDRQR